MITRPSSQPAPWLTHQPATETHHARLARHRLWPAIRDRSLERSLGKVEADQLQRLSGQIVDRDHREIAAAEQEAERLGLALGCAERS